MKPQIRVSVVPFIRAAEPDCDPPLPELPFYCVRVVGNQKDIDDLYMNGKLDGDYFELEDDTDVYLCMMDTPDKKEANAKAKELRVLISQLTPAV
jgi:hypothetical protein